MKQYLVTGAGGFIGGHLVEALLRDGYGVRAVDIKPAGEWDQWFPDAENCDSWDLKDPTICEWACEDIDEVFNLAADMGGIGFIEKYKADCMLSVLISTNMLLAARKMGVSKFFYSSSACAYAADKQTNPNVTALKESDAYPAMPEDGYGWEKLFSERMARHFREDYGLETRIARFHNVYGPYGTYDGGREKAPSAICRKVIEAKMSGDHKIEIWGDGKQTRSFMYIDDCVGGARMILAGDYNEPLNLGSSELVTINQLVDIAEDIAGVKLRREYDLTKPQGVRGRNSDNTLILNVFGWEPDVPLATGLEKTYRWIWDEMNG